MRQDTVCQAEHNAAVAAPSCMLMTAQLHLLITRSRYWSTDQACGPLHSFFPMRACALTLARTSLAALHCWRRLAK